MFQIKVKFLSFLCLRDPPDRCRSKLNLKFQADLKIIGITCTRNKGQTGYEVFEININRFNGACSLIHGEIIF